MALEFEISFFNAVFLLINFKKRKYFYDICNDEKMGQLTYPFKIPHQEKS